MPASYIGVSSDTGTSVSFNRPAAAVAGHMLILLLATNGTVSTPAGWTSLLTRNTSNIDTRVCWRVASGTVADNISGVGSSATTGIMLAYDGVVAPTLSANAASLNTGSIITTDNAWLVTGTSTWFGSAVTHTRPGYTSRLSVGQQLTINRLTSTGFDIGSLQPAGTYSSNGTSSNGSEHASFILAMSEAIVIVDGAAALTTDSDLSAAGAAHGEGASALTADGTLTATAEVLDGGVGHFTADGDLTAAASMIALGSAAFTADGTLTAAGQCIVDGAVSTQTADGALTAAGEVLGEGTAVLTATGTQTAAAMLIVFGVAALVAQGATTAASTIITVWDDRSANSVIDWEYQVVAFGVNGARQSSGWVA
jgi:hypothetical protein